MIKAGWTLDHIGIAVIDLEAAISLHTRLTGAVVTAREELPDQGVSLAFISTPGTQLELLTPTRKDSTLARFIEKRGAGLHHVCFHVDNVEEELKALSLEGFRLIDSAPRHGARGSRIAFIHPSSCQGVLTELCDYRSHQVGS